MLRINIKSFTTRIFELRNTMRNNSVTETKNNMNVTLKRN